MKHFFKRTPLFISLGLFMCLNTGCFTILSSIMKSEDKVTIEEQVVLNTRGIKITAKEFDKSGSWLGPTFTFLIENNASYSITVQARDVKVNGEYTVDHVMSVDVAQGTKATDDLTLYDSDLEKNNIKTIYYIEFDFHIFNSDTWVDSFDTPVRINTSAYTE